MPMDTAIAGLIGASIGAAAGMTGTLLAQILQSRREHRKWLLSKKEDAYSNSLRYLLKALNRRSKITADGIAILSKEDMPEWFADLGETQSWITSLTIYCSSDVRDTIKQVAGKFNGVISTLMGNDVLIAAEHPNENKSDRIIVNQGLDNLAETVSFAYTDILKCAQKELGEHIR